MKRLFIGFVGLISISCYVSSEKNPLDLKETIKGFWHYHERDSTYSEVVISDKIYWGYDDRFGVIAYDYELSHDTVKRFYQETGNPFGALKINKFTNDTIWAIGNTDYEFVLHRLNLDLNLEKVINEDSTALDRYIIGYRDRKQSWEEEHRLHGPKKY